MKLSLSWVIQIISIDAMDVRLIVENFFLCNGDIIGGTDAGGEKTNTRRTFLFVTQIIDSC
jgi:hypothetical protein